MMPDDLDADFLNVLRGCDTPTICNAIEVAQGQRGFDGYTRRTMIATSPDSPPLVGFARTARIASAAPDTAPKAEMRARRMEYFRHMAGSPLPAVAVIEDVDGASAAGAWWGEVHARVHRAFGLSGTVTNGLVRDLGDLPADFPIIAGGIGPSHAFVHVRDFGAGAQVHGVDVAEGALVHADRHGMVVIPASVIEDLPRAISTLRASEKIVFDALDAASGRMGFEDFAKAWVAFENART